VQQIAWAGQHFTEQRQIERAVSGLKGAALLTVDPTALARKLQRLPAVSTARVDGRLPNALRIEIVEKVPTFVWQTSAVRLLGVPDGTLIGQVARGSDLPAELAALPLIDDQRTDSRSTIVGDRIDPISLAAALRLSAVAPAALGSMSNDVNVRITDEDGFLLVSTSPAWQADFGFYAPPDSGELATLDEQVSAQVAAVRTLFAFQSETGVSWVDARDPGRVYWRP